MRITITQEPPDSSDARELIAELDAYLTPLYPASSRYGYSVEKLIKEQVALFILRCDGSAAGCGGLLCVGKEYAEIKRLYVRPAFRGKGLGAMMLEHLEIFACQQGLSVLRLETGTLQPEALRLYEHLGYHQTTSFGAYIASPYNLFYEKHLT